MNILVVEARESVGGGQVMTKNICDALSKNNQVSVFLPGNDKSPLAKLLDEYPHFYYKHREYTRGKKGLKDYFLFLSNFFFSFICLKKVLCSQKIDMIYVQHLSMLPIIVAVNCLFNVKIVAHVHVVYTDKRARWMVNKLLKSKNVVRVIGVSNYSLSQFSGLDNRKCRVIFNPVVSLPPVNSLSQDEYNIAIVGDVCESKGHHVLLKALAGRDENFKVHIIGNVIDEQYRQYLDAQYPDVKHIYTGMIPDVAGYMRDHSVVVVVVVSVVGFETFSLAMVEAWGMGIPTVATNDFGMKELVERFLPEYSEKVLFPLGDSESLYIRIRNLLSDKTFYNDFSRQAWNVVNEQLNNNNFSIKLNQIIGELPHD